MKYSLFGQPDIVKYSRALSIGEILILSRVEITLDMRRCQLVFPSKCIRLPCDAQMR